MSVELSPGFHTITFRDGSFLRLPLSFSLSSLDYRKLSCVSLSLFGHFGCLYCDWRGLPYCVGTRFDVNTGVMLDYDFPVDGICPSRLTWFLGLLRDYPDPREVTDDRLLRDITTTLSYLRHLQEYSSLSNLENEYLRLSRDPSTEVSDLNRLRGRIDSAWNKYFNHEREILKNLNKELDRQTPRKHDHNIFNFDLRSLQSAMRGDVLTLESSVPNVIDSSVCSSPVCSSSVSSSIESPSVSDSGSCSGSCSGSVITNEPEVP